jgi:hypothetical protein
VRGDDLGFRIRWRGRWWGSFERFAHGGKQPASLHV